MTVPKKRKKKQRVELPTEAKPEWRELARKAGWSDLEVETLDSVLALSRLGEDRVVDVGANSVLLYSVIPYRFSGIDRDGAVRGSVVTRGRWWRWHVSRPVSVVYEAAGARDASERSWCPGHGLTCNPREPNTCGLHTKVVSWHWEPCNCPHVKVGNPKSHLDGCEAPKIAAYREEERRVAALVAEADAAQEFDDSIEEKSARKPERRQRPSKRSDWVLPGQASFALPAPRKSS